MTHVKLYTRDDGFVTEGDLPPFTEPPEILFWGARCFVRDPWRIYPDDEWVRYREAWAMALIHETAAP